MTTAQTKETLAKQLIKAQGDLHFSRLEKVAYTKVVTGIQDEGKLHSISPNEILTLAMEKQDQYQEQLQKQYNIPYITYRPSEKVEKVNEA